MAEIEQDLYELAQAQAAHDADGLWGYEPLPEVLPWLRSRAKIRVILGGNRASKTQTAAWEFARWARGEQVSKELPEVPHPKRGKLELLCVAIDYNKIGEVNYAKLFLPGQYIKYRYRCPKCGEFVFKSADRAEKSTYLVIVKNNARSRFEAWDGVIRCPFCATEVPIGDAPAAWKWEAPPLIPEKCIEKIVWQDKGKNIPAFVETANARIAFLSGESGRDHFQGPRWHKVWIDEELGDDAGGVWSEILRGTADFNGQIDWSATPLARQNALIELSDRFKAGDKDVFQVVLGLVHNHHIPLSARESVAKSWPRDQWRCRIKGEFFALEGLVYPEFSRAVHVIPRFDTAALKLTWYRSIDPGIGTTAVLWFGVDQYGDYLITDELCMESGNIATLVEQIREIDAGRTIVNTTIDPSDQRSLTCREGLRVVLARDYNVPCHSNFSRDVNQGIFRIKEDLVVNKERKRPRAQAFEDLQNLIREMTRYRRGDKTKTADRTDKVVKKDDHFCFPAGQMVNTVDGPRPIESLRRNDVLLAHDGTCKVEFAVCSGENEVFRLTFADGRCIICTGEHQIATTEGWFAAKDALGRKALTCQRKPSATKDFIIGDTQTPRTAATGCTSSEPTRQPPNISIGPYGRINTVLCRLAKKYITWTATPATTTSAISLLKRIVLTWQNIRQVLSCLPNEENTWTRFVRSPRSGIEVQRAGSGTLLMLNAPLLRGNQRLTSAVIAANDSRPSVSGAMVSVPTTANPPGAEKPVSMLWNGNVRLAERLSASVAITRRDAVRSNAPGSSVVKVEKLPGLHRVYNLTTSSGTYYVNGTLVSNCDAWRYRRMAGLEYVPFPAPQGDGRTFARKHYDEHFGKGARRRALEVVL